MTDQVIDCHHHLLDLRKGTYPWLEEEDPEGTEIVGDYSATTAGWSMRTTRSLQCGLRPRGIRHFGKRRALLPKPKTIMNREWNQQCQKLHE